MAEWKNTPTESPESWGCREGLLLLASFCDLGKVRDPPERPFPRLHSLGDSPPVLSRANGRG